MTPPVALLLVGVVHAYEISEIPVTRWPEAFAPDPVTPADLARGMPELPFRVEELQERLPPAATPPAGLRGRVLVLVEEPLVEPLAQDLDVLLDDLTLDGHAALLEAAADGSGEELREHLQALADEDAGLEGALLVGDLPMIWYEFANDYDAYGYAVFPSDLALADLDGGWEDRDGNGILDWHSTATLPTSDPSPELWIGRLIAGSHLGERVEVLARYLARDHAFRRGEILPVGSSLVYVDDDWATWTQDFAREIRPAFPDVTAEGSLDVTRADDYIPRLTQDYDNIAVFVHSSPAEHYFVYRGAYDEMYWDEVPEDATALFYDLFACSNANFGESVFMGGVYALGTEYGLLALGSTKTGSMLERPYYYDRLAAYEEFGAALRGWWEDVLPYDVNQRANWYFGMTQIGDPSLRVGFPTVGLSVDGIVVDQDEPGPMQAEVELTNLGADRYAWGLGLEGGELVDVPWIAASATVGEVGDTVVLTLDDALAVGADPTVTLLVHAPGATNNPVALPVEIRRWGTPALCASPDPIAVALAGPDDEVAVDLAIGNCAPGPLSWAASASDPWIDLSATAGDAAEGSDAVEVRVGGRGLQAGSTAAGSLTLTSPVAGVAPVTVPVAVTVGSDGCGCAGRGPRRSTASLALAGLALLTGARRRTGRAP